jgi:hypothetical protein
MDFASSVQTMRRRRRNSEDLASRTQSADFAFIDPVA